MAGLLRWCRWWNSTLASMWTIPQANLYFDTAETRRGADQKTSLAPVRSKVGLSDTELEVTCSVRGVRVSKIRQVGPETHLQVNNLDPSLARGGKYPPCRSDCRLNYRNVDPCTIEQPALRTKVVLHVYDDYRSPRSSDRYWVRVSFNGH